jgi:hypothetical protein
MFSKNCVVPPAILLAAVLVSACDSFRSPSTPSPAPSPTPSPTPSPAPDLSHLVGVWNLTLRLTDVKGDGCVATTMSSQIGVPNRYSLSVIQTGGTVDATLRSASGDYLCTFTNVFADSSGFTTLGRRDSCLTCLWAVVLRDFRCSNGTLNDLISWSQDISARVSGTEISGQWSAGFSDGPPLLGTTFAETKAEFTGSR